MTIPPRAYAVPQNDPNYSPPPLPTIDLHIRGAMNDGFKLGVGFAASMARAAAAASPANSVGLMALAEALDEAKDRPLLNVPGASA